MGRRTVTGMLSSSGNQFSDWSSAYRLFSKQRIDMSELFSVIQKGVVEQNSDLKYIVAHMDDTIIKKTGKKISGTSWRRDPLGPPFHTNFIWGQRFIQISLALANQGTIGQSRAIPVDFYHSPSVAKPNKKAESQEWEHYKEQKKIQKLSRQGQQRISNLRETLDQQGYQQKELLVGVDGSYTNKEVLKNLPANTTLIGRTRKDSKLYMLPDEQKGSGRKRVYGDPLPTPEQIRQSEKYPWQKVKAWAAGKVHNFDIKVVKDVRWKSAGKQDLSLIIIRPLGYRLSKNAKVLYRSPAYLICTETDISIQKLLQAYLWRWEIEVDFREEKTLMGCGQAQVRNPNSAEKLPAFVAATYAILHLATHKAKNHSNELKLPRPKWYKKKPNQRETTGDLLNNLRAQIWAKSTEMDFNDFVNNKIYTRSGRNNLQYCNTAPFYIRN